MKKLKLDLDALHVDTFQTAASDARRGTVRGAGLDPNAPMVGADPMTMMPIVSTDDPLGCSGGGYSCGGDC